MSLLSLSASLPEIDNSLIRAPILRRSSRAEHLSLTLANRRKRSLEKRDPFQAPLYNDDGSQYLIQIGVGSPAQNFTVTLDTGSADLWIPSSSCPTTSCPYSRFDPTASSTYKNLNTAFSIQYGIGSVNGSYSTDTVTIAGAQVTNQQFGLASSTSDILTTGSSSMGGTGSGTPGQNSSSDPSKPTGNGILGLGYPSLTASTTSGKSTSPYNPAVFNMVQQKLIANPIFSIYMNKESASGWAGEVIFGGVDSSKYTGDLVYLPVAPLSTASIGSNSNYYYWMVYAQGISVTGTGSNTTDQSYSFTSSKTGTKGVGTFILDTGTTLTYLPTTMAESIISSVAGGSSGYQLDSSSQTYYIDCAKASSSASVVLQMSQSSQVSSNPVTLSVPVSNLVIPLDASTADQARLCMFGIAPMQTSSSNGIGSSMLLIGDSFLRSAYMVFDMGQNRVGLAAANGLGGAVNGVASSTTSDVFVFFA
ncbi:aspartic peptidase domain-containing protein [Halteromyces radiatus]|uniref:aspartic peptidase domain-containing protein n=1 Tax=Halteromyces radiatus TaxID=101107 RepID=UPI00221F4185|nr:aspartic peptidase domain-containing protein [Halteromyces radiatus]KAI8089826.1 aspartic peptidase domain-containing protein [Halteromyces radiatus]